MYKIWHPFLYSTKSLKKSRKILVCTWLSSYINDSFSIFFFILPTQIYIDPLQYSSNTLRDCKCVSKVIKISHIPGPWTIALCNFSPITSSLTNIQCYYVNDRKLKRVILNDILRAARVRDGGLGPVIRGPRWQKTLIRSRSGQTDHLRY